MSIPEYQRNKKCGKCGKPATWIRRHQFADDHNFCDEHAQKEKNFNVKGDPLFFWLKWREPPQGSS